MGSWNTMVISTPQKCFSLLAPIANTSRPSKSTVPPTWAYEGSRFMRALAVTDLPEPDSPTTPSV